MDKDLKSDRSLILGLTLATRSINNIFEAEGENGNKQVNVRLSIADLVALIGIFNSAQKYLQSKRSLEEQELFSDEQLNQMLLHSVEMVGGFMAQHWRKQVEQAALSMKNQYSRDTKPQ